ncbi:hypothetical protein M3212_12370 [Alkalihalobacillus oceani]|uniref:hypothetical protein n=1 Tax=Halalkalibacter oceani TaxID=1653776 RepID=UPI002040730F|nr:hypothetical protein [Halalkalibacter oceani]MCM3761581.1 hypothetical protein [Halalkalibacter oceani]
MHISKQKQESFYLSFKQIQFVQRIARKKHKKSPTIAEIAAITGDSEEYILESMEFGQASPPEIQTYYH